MAIILRNHTIRQKNLALPILGIFVLIAVFFVWRFIVGPSPEDVRQSAVRAFEKGDARALCALADPEELKITGLTPEKVELLLRSTLWENELPREVTVDNRVEETAVDQGFWNVRWKNKQGKYKMVVMINDHPKNGWHLNLSWTLFSICVWKYGYQGTAHYYQFAHENHVVGFRDQSGAYNNPRYFGDLASTAVP